MNKTKGNNIQTLSYKKYEHKETFSFSHSSRCSVCTSLEPQTFLFMFLKSYRVWVAMLYFDSSFMIKW